MARFTLITVVAVAVGAACQASTGPALESSAVGDHSNGGRNGSPQSGGDVRCVGVLSGSFDNVTVPVGATCTLQSSTVKGNVKALESSRLFVSNTQVGGNIQGDKARVVHVTGGIVVGNIQIVQGTSPGELGAAVTGGTVVTGGNIQIEKMNTATIVVADARVEKGNIQIVENSTSAALDIVRNSVAQNLQVFKNHGTGTKSVTGNTVRQDLQCKENTSPFAGGPNAAAEAEGQCF